MVTIDLHEAQPQLLALLDRVEQGETIAISRDGAVIAILKPAFSTTTVDVEDTIEAIRTFRKGLNLNGLDIKAMINEGHSW